MKFSNFIFGETNCADNIWYLALQDVPEETFDAKLDFLYSHPDVSEIIENLSPPNFNDPLRKLIWKGYILVFFFAIIHFLLEPLQHDPLTTDATSEIKFENADFYIENGTALDNSPDALNEFVQKYGHERILKRIEKLIAFPELNPLQLIPSKS